MKGRLIIFSHLKEPLQRTKFYLTKLEALSIRTDQVFLRRSCIGKTLNHLRQNFGYLACLFKWKIIVFSEKENFSSPLIISKTTVEKLGFLLYDTWASNFRRVQFRSPVLFPLDGRQLHTSVTGESFPFGSVVDSKSTSKHFVGNTLKSPLVINSDISQSTSSDAGVAPSGRKVCLNSVLTERLRKHVSKKRSS